MKQIGLGLMMYVQDYDERMPGFKIHRYSGNSNARGDGWYDSLEPYVNNEQIAICPSARYDSTYGRGDMPNATGYWGRTLTASYGVPAQDSTCRSVLGTLGTMFSSYYPPGPSIAQVTKPAETVMVFESNSNWTQQTSGYGRDNSGNLRSISADGTRGRQTFRHNGQMNVAFADGHAKSVGPGYMADLDVYRRVK